MLISILLLRLLSHLLFGNFFLFYQLLFVHADLPVCENMDFLYLQVLYRFQAISTPEYSICFLLP